MKTISKTTKLNLQKFQIVKLNNLNTIIGGANANYLNKEENKNLSSADTWTIIGG